MHNLYLSAANSKSFKKVIQVKVVRYNRSRLFKVIEITTN